MPEKVPYAFLWYLCQQLLGWKHRGRKVAFLPKNRARSSKKKRREASLSWAFAPARTTGMTVPFTAMAWRQERFGDNPGASAFSECDGEAYPFPTLHGGISAGRVRGAAEAG